MAIQKGSANAGAARLVIVRTAMTASANGRRVLRAIFRMTRAALTPARCDHGADRLPARPASLGAVRAPVERRRVRDRQPASAPGQAWSHWHAPLARRRAPSTASPEA